MRAGPFRAIDCVVAVILLVLCIGIIIKLIIKLPLDGADEWPGAGGVISCCLMACLTAAIAQRPVGGDDLGVEIVAVIILIVIVIVIIILLLLLLC